MVKKTNGSDKLVLPTLYKKNDNKRNMKKTIRKNELKRLVESVLNEISSDTAYRASKIADRRGEKMRKAINNDLDDFDWGDDADSMSKRTTRLSKQYPQLSTDSDASYGEKIDARRDNDWGVHDDYLRQRDKFKRYGDNRRLKELGLDDMADNLYPIESYNRLVNQISESVIRRLRRG